MNREARQEIVRRLKDLRHDLEISTDYPLEKEPAVHLLASVCLQLGLDELQLTEVLGPAAYLHWNTRVGPLAWLQHYEPPLPPTDSDNGHTPRAHNAPRKDTP